MLFKLLCEFHGRYELQPLSVHIVNIDETTENWGDSSNDDDKGLARLWHRTSHYASHVSAAESPKAAGVNRTQLGSANPVIRTLQQLAHWADSHLSTMLLLTPSPEVHVPGFPSTCTIRFD